MNQAGRVRERSATAFAHNFREIRGLQTQDGRRIASGRFFRTGVFRDSAKDNLNDVPVLDLRLFVDLRGPSERFRRPYRWSEDARLSYVASEREVTNASIEELLRNPDSTAESMRAEVIALYEELPFLLARELSFLLAGLANGLTPVVVGCTAGKDRTGVATMVCLSVLGIRWDDIVADYLASNAALETLVHIASEQLQIEAGRENLRPALVCETKYIETAMNAIRKRCKSLDGYLRDVLAIDTATQDRIRDQLLEHGPHPR